MSLGLHNYHGRYVYRVLRPDEDPFYIRCLAPRNHCSIGEHVENGLRVPSCYISTCSTLQCAYNWLNTANAQTAHIYGNERTTIVKIDVALIKLNYPNVASAAIDLTQWFNQGIFLENEKQRRFAACYNEIVFQYVIPSEAVSIEYSEYPNYRMSYNASYDSSYREPVYIVPKPEEGGGVNCCVIICVFIFVFFILPAFKMNRNE